MSARQPHTLPLPKGINTMAGSDTPFSGKASAAARLLINHNGAVAPNDIWVYDLATGKSHQVTHSLSAGVRSEDMVEPFLVHYPSKDGKFQTSPFFSSPSGARRHGKTPPILPTPVDRTRR